MWSLTRKCTCKNKNLSNPENKHFLDCDLMYGKNSYPRKKKRFGLFFPMKVVK